MNDRGGFSNPSACKFSAPLGVPWCWNALVTGVWSAAGGCRQMFPQHTPWRPPQPAEPPAAAQLQPAPGAAPPQQQVVQQEPAAGAPAVPRLQQQLPCQAAAGAPQLPVPGDPRHQGAGVQVPPPDPQLQRLSAPPAAAAFRPMQQAHVSSHLDPGPLAQPPHQAPADPRVVQQQQQAASQSMPAQPAMQPLPHLAAQQHAPGPPDPRLQGMTDEGAAPQGMQQVHVLMRLPGTVEHAPPTAAAGGHPPDVAQPPALPAPGSIAGALQQGRAGGQPHPQPTQPPPILQQRPPRQMTGFKAHTMQYKR